MSILTGCGCSSAKATKQGGIVLPVVLVMLVLMTTVVLFMSRRGALDERLASNVRAVISIDTAAQYTLRWCELWLWVSPPGIAPVAGMPSPPQTVEATPGAANPMWRTATWSADAVALPNDAVLGANTAQCLFEDARNELVISPYSAGQGGLPIESPRRKFRITAQVTSPGAYATVVARAQSEVSMNLN